MEHDIPPFAHFYEFRSTGYTTLSDSIECAPVQYRLPVFRFTLFNENGIEVRREDVGPIYN